MELFERMGSLNHGRVHLKLDPDSRLRTIVAIHDTRLGPALGGCRFIPYATEEAAVTDALRLARAMTSKAALARLAHGGGKAVIMRPEGDFERERLLESFARFVEVDGPPTTQQRGQHRARPHRGRPTDPRRVQRGVAAAAGRQSSRTRSAPTVPRALGRSTIQIHYDCRRKALAGRGALLRSSESWIHPTRPAGVRMSRQSAA